MKNSITGLIAIIGISVGFLSVAEASDRDRGHYSDKRIVKKMRHDDDRRWKYRQNESRRSHRDQDYGHRENRFRRVDKHRHYKKGHRFAKKHFHDHRGRYYIDKRGYHRNGRRIVEKHIYHRAPRHRVEKRVYHHYAPRHRVVERVIVGDRHHHGHGNPLPALAGGIIGSAIANDLSYGDPAATFGGAVFGAMLGDALSHH